MTPISLGIFASANITTNTSFESIATTTVGSGGSSYVEFTSIPSTYAHLQVRMIVRTDRGAEQDSAKLQFNNDTTSGNYYLMHYLSGNGSIVTVDAQGTGAYISVPRFAASSATASNFGVAILDILDYASTNKHKTIRNLSGYDNNGSGQVYFSSGLWFPSSISAITSMKFSPLSGTNFVANSQFALYGIKAAA